MGRDVTKTPRWNTLDKVIGTLALLMAAMGGYSLSGALQEGPATFFSSVALNWSVIVFLTAVTLLALLACALELCASRLLLVSLVVGMTLSIAAAELRQTYPVQSVNSFPKVFARYHSKNGNLSEGLITGSRLLQGKGNTIEDGPNGIGVINTYRMPGYPLFVAFAGWLFHADPADRLSIGTSTIYLHICFFLVAIAALTYSLSVVFPLPITALLALAVCWFPQNFDQTQNDSIVISCGLLITSALCLYYEASKRLHRIPLKYHLMVHVAFALYLLVRSDVMIGWAGVSLLLYRKQWRYLAIPLVLFLAIGLSWGTYKVSHGTEFVMTTSNVGHVAFVGLWQVPWNKFVWQPTDESYDKWISSHGYKYGEPSANGFATREVVRFWLTYPGFIAGNFCFKFYVYFRLHAWEGQLKLLPSLVFGIGMRLIGYWLLLLTVLIALVLRFEVERTLLLSWPIFLSLPIFCILQESGPRFVGYISCSFLFAAAPLLFDMRFYKVILKSRKQLAAIAGMALILWIFAMPLAPILLSDRFRYWTPFLDPLKSTLNIFK